MQSFAYRGKNASGGIITGTLDAMDAVSVAKILNERSITPIEINRAEQTVAKASKNATEINVLTPKVRIEDQIIFCRQMYSLTKAGVPIIHAMSGLTETKSIRLKAALLDIIEQLEKGRNLSSALSQHPRIFSQLFVSIIHVGENTGQLDIAFKQLADYLERDRETRKQIKAATRYPTFVIIALMSALVILNVFVIPIFADMFESFNTELPLMTRILITTSNFFINQWYVIVGVLLLLVIITKKYLDTQKGRLVWDHFKLKAPVFGEILERSILSRFSRSFSLMLRSGVPLTSALSLVAEAVDNAHMHRAIIEMRRRIEKGEDLARVSKASGLFTPLVLQMISVGEETGRVDDLLKEVAEFYEQEVEYDIKSLTSKIEPILITIVAGMVLVLALGIFTPMWEMMGAIK
ncbi:MAG: type II secretion system F family protein [Pseudomonadota bacterium]